MYTYARATFIVKYLQMFLMDVFHSHLWISYIGHWSSSLKVQECVENVINKIFTNLKFVWTHFSLMEHLDLEFATKYLIVSFYYFQFLHQKLLMWFTEAVWRRSNRKSSYFKNLTSKKSMILLNNFNSSTKYIFYV